MSVVIHRLQLHNLTLARKETAMKQIRGTNLGNWLVLEKMDAATDIRGFNC